MTEAELIEQPHEATLRERKKLATRRALRVHALDLFAAKGFSKVTVEDIAAAADVSPRTFFNYFPSKEAVLFGTDPGRPERIGREVAAQPASLSALEAISNVLVAEARALEADLQELGPDPASILALMKAAAADPDFVAARAVQLAGLERALATAAAERLQLDAARDALPALLATTAVGAVKASMYLWAQRGGRSPLERVAAAALRAVGDGLNSGCKELARILDKEK